MEAKEYTIALAGNPNVGKSTIFNSLTGMHQHTGNWSGKTVDLAVGTFTYKSKKFNIVDLPGTYSLFNGINEEGITSDYLCFENYDAVVIVADAVCLERNLNLVLQIVELTDNAVLSVNLMDEAKKKNISIDINKLSGILGIPVISTSAVNNRGIDELIEQIYKTSTSESESSSDKSEILYSKFINVNKKSDISFYDETIINVISPFKKYFCDKGFSEKFSQWAAIRVCEYDEDFNIKLFNKMNLSEDSINNIETLLSNESYEHSGNISIGSEFKDLISEIFLRLSSEIYSGCVTINIENYNCRDRKLDDFFTSKITGYPVMILLLCGIFWITIVGANYPSTLLSNMFYELKNPLSGILDLINTPVIIKSLIIDGIYKTLTWVISVMLPPMAIFFPLFTLLEDSGYLPRIAFNLDRYFRKACAHGKQSLTMCMGFGCNACGITGCRIIDSPREKLIAMITNVFVPCNGRFPGIIALISIFLMGNSMGMVKSFKAAAILCLVIVFGILMTLIISMLLSKTILKGLSSSFILELPPYRKPQFFQVIIRSIKDRTIFVLGRAMVVAAPAGAVIWAMANIKYGDSSILNICSNFLDPFAELMGLDGIILMAFILGWPANEIVIPIIIMGYMASGTLTDYGSLLELKTLLINNGWTVSTAICTILFSLIHFPCATTCLTIYKETKSLKWTFTSFIIPALTGIVVCMGVNFVINFIL